MLHEVVESLYAEIMFSDRFSVLLMFQHRSYNSDIFSIMVQHPH